jgi:hypothetical protein
MSGLPGPGPRSTRLEGWRRVFAELGPLDASLYLASRILDKFSGGRIRLIKYHVVAQPVPGTGGGVLRPDRNTRIDFAAPDSPLCVHFPRPPHVIGQRYASGAVCIAAESGGRFAGFLWLRRSGYDEDEVRCRYVLDDPERSVWDFDVYVEPSFRLGRTMARLWQAADRHLVAQGVQWSFSRISAFNASSLGAHARLGLVRCHTATFLLVGQSQLAFVPQWPFVHASLRDSQRPTIRLRAPGRDDTARKFRPLARP